LEAAVSQKGTLYVDVPTSADITQTRLDRIDELEFRISAAEKQIYRLEED